ncbi:uncharacterized protein LOC144451424 [Glandiceps talaboti]
MATVVTRHNRNISSAGSQGTVPTGLAPTICRAPLVRPTFLEGATKSANIGQRSVLHYLENRHSIEQTCNLPQIKASSQTSPASRESSASHRRQIGLPKFSLAKGPCTSAKRKEDEPLRTSTESTLVKTAICLETVNISEEDSTEVNEEGVATSPENNDHIDYETESGQIYTVTDDTEEIKDDNKDEESLDEDILEDVTIAESESEGAVAKTVTKQRPKSKPKSSKRNSRKSRAKSSRNRRKSSKRRHFNKSKTPNNTVEESIVEETDEGIETLNKLEYVFDCGPTISKAPQLNKSIAPKKSKQQFFHIQSIKQASLIYGQHLPRMSKTSSFHGAYGAVDHSNNSAYVFCKAATSDTLSPWKLNTGEKLHLTRVYLSEKQSGVMRECGGHYPCAPPATPTIELYDKYEYVPCMSDIRSQRAVKARLSDIQAIEQKKKQRKKEEARKSELQRQKDSIIEEKQRQRLEIYALNKIMTAFENQNFRQFCEMQLKVENSG